MRLGSFMVYHGVTEAVTKPVTLHQQSKVKRGEWKETSIKPGAGKNIDKTRNINMYPLVI